MAKVLALYKTPGNPAEFNRYYFERHVPLAKQLPDLKSYAVSQGPVMGMAGQSDIHFAAIIEFDSLADIEAALSSEAGKRIAEDLGNFASAGVELLFFDTREV